MSNQRPIRTARRHNRQRDRERQGIAVPPCILCIENHHTAGKHSDAKLVAPLCQKHHRAIQEQLLTTGVPLSFEPDVVRRVANALRCAAVYDRERAEAMERWANSLEQSKEHNDDV
jgi:hypothetical protein